MQWPPSPKRLLELKIDKALRRHAGDEQPDAASIKMASEAEHYRQGLAEELAIIPYLRVTKIGRSNNCWTHFLVEYRVWNWPQYFLSGTAGASGSALSSYTGNLSYALLPWRYPQIKTFDRSASYRH
ncbi:hypothetical protein [Cohaesibacter intestini]|uniref:hypothetical protein n=1 Tax=Cohaesibacter intestini TaxID=2211145 RepID=UPI000DEA6703|nr:hypothetical protein [Cohaesibacter intestini]